MLCKLLLPLVIATSSSAMAQVGKQMTFRVGNACDGNGEMCGARVYAEGEIVAETPDRFMTFVRANRSRLPPVPWVSFHSPGGNMFAGIRLGQHIRRLGFDTQLLSDQSCASACSLAFLGGSTRSVEEGSRFGVHQFSAATGNVGDAATQVTVVAVAAYIESMGVNRKLLDVASLVPASAIYWLKSSQLQELRVDNSESLYSEWALDSTQSGEPFARAALLLPGDRLSVSYTFARSGPNLVLRISMSAPSNKSERLSTLYAVLEGEPIYFSSGSQSVFESGPIRWRASQTSLQADVAVPRSVAAKIRTEQSFSIGFQVPRVASDMDPSVSTSGSILARYLAVLLR